MKQEPKCTCTRLDVDLYDASGCELCDPESEWNRQQEFSLVSLESEGELQCRM